MLCIDSISLTTGLFLPRKLSRSLFCGFRVHNRAFESDVATEHIAHLLPRVVDDFPNVFPVSTERNVALSLSFAFNFNVHMQSP